MRCPYKVTVDNVGGTVKVTINPPPAPKDKERLPEITERFQGIIVAYQGRGTFLDRKKLGRELMKALQEYHQQGLIVPKVE